MLYKSWRDTKIFNELIKRCGVIPNDVCSNVKIFLENPDTLNKIELIINKGSTTPKDFTLHDADHSFRVAERIWELIPDITQKYLSEFELALLLLSAYLHDIGMSPEFEKVEKHRRYLTELNSTDLNIQQINEFQTWIDNQNDLGQIDIRTTKVTNHNKGVNILKYYIRHKHNDWSGEWIDENLSSIPLPGYSSFIKDLNFLCKSHHYGLDHLLNAKFDLKPISNSGKYVHLRYLAMCLRVADVMENDPERTPEVLLKHRFITQDSLSYWLKDDEFSLLRETNKYKIFARPTKAFIQKAILETSDYIEAELRLCDELSNRKQQDFTVFKDRGHQYKWDIIAYIDRDIEPFDNSYLYFKGSFRPNTSKILELLGGHQLYGDPIYAFRELLQNSFDSVKEKIAYSLLNLDNFTEENERNITALSEITIKLENKIGNWWLSVTDNGVGMTAQIIEKFFLESGSSKRHEISELERRCKDKGVDFNRTGQFGIGVLSYFMLADTIFVKTKRTQNTGYSDEELKGLSFEINGLHDFGELKLDPTLTAGTTVNLKLKKEISDNIDRWNKTWASFLKSEIIKSPCKVSYESTYDSKSSSISNWSINEKDLTSQLIEQFKTQTLHHTQINNLTSSFEDRERKNKYKILFDECAVELQDKIDYLILEGNVANFGQYRIFFPYFKLLKGNSLVYVREYIENDEHKLLEIAKGYWWKPQIDQLRVSLKGIKINTQIRIGNTVYSQSPMGNAYIEINVESAVTDKLSVSRQSIEFDTGVYDTFNYILEKARKFIVDNFNMFDNCYSSLYTDLFITAPKNIFWCADIDQHKGGDIIWSEVQYPVLGWGVMSHFIKNKAYRYKNEYVSVSKDLQAFKDGSHLNWMTNCKGLYAFLNFDDRHYAMPVLLSKPDMFVPYKNQVSSIIFPNQGAIIDIFKKHVESNSSRIFINVSNPDHSLFNESLYEEYIDKARSNFRENVQKIGLSKSNNYTFLICTILLHSDERTWKGLCENNKSIIEELFQNSGKVIFFLADDSNVYFYTSSFSRQESSNRLNITDLKNDDFKLKKVI